MDSITIYLMFLCMYATYLSEKQRTYKMCSYTLKRENVNQSEVKVVLLKKKLWSIGNGDHVKVVGEQFLGPIGQQFPFYRNRPSQLNPHQSDLTQTTFPLLHI